MDAKSWARCLKVLPYLVLVIVLTALYGIYTQFLPSAGYSKYIQVFSFLFSCVLVIISYVAYFKKGSQWRQNLKEKQSIWVTVLVIPLVLFLIPYMSFTIGLPALLHQFVSNDGFSIYRVEYKYSHYDIRGCSGGVRVNNGGLMNIEVCDMPYNIWHGIKSGDDLLLSGQKSIFGLSYNKVLHMKKFSEES